jgi:hypothetical protein
MTYRRARGEEQYLTYLQARDHLSFIFRLGGNVSLIFRLGGNVSLISRLGVISDLSPG